MEIPAWGKGAGMNSESDEIVEQRVEEEPVGAVHVPWQLKVVAFLI